METASTTSGGANPSLQPPAASSSSVADTPDLDVSPATMIGAQDLITTRWTVKLVWAMAIPPLEAWSTLHRIYTLHSCQ
jgi:hypothetical protein